MVEQLGKVSETARGFSIVEFEDRNGHKCSIQCSSAIDLTTESEDMPNPGASMLWVGVSDASPQILASDARKLGIPTEQQYGWIPYAIPPEVLLSTRMHLSRAQVQGLVDRLQYWLKNGDL